MAPVNSVVKPMCTGLTRRDRGGRPAAHVASWTSADSITCIANRFWDLMPLRRDQKLFPHFGEAGTAVFAVEEVEYGGGGRNPPLVYLPAFIFLPGQGGCI